MKIFQGVGGVTPAEIVALAALLIVSACERQGRTDPPLPQLDGKTKADAVRHLGPPRLERGVEPGKALNPCRGADRALEYDWPQTGSGTRIRKWLGMRPAQVLLLCVDKSDKILSSSTFTVD